jgi:hypothetical protein
MKQCTYGPLRKENGGRFAESIRRVGPANKSGKENFIIFSEK